MDRLFIVADPCTRPITAENIKTILESFRPAMGTLLRPTVVERKSGIIGLFIAEDRSLTLSTSGNRLVLEISGMQEFDLNKYMKPLLSFATLEHIRQFEVTKELMQHIECQEPRCRYPATKDYEGMKLCRDHFEIWQEKERDVEWEKDMR